MRKRDFCNQIFSLFAVNICANKHTDTEVLVGRVEKVFCLKFNPPAP